MLFFEFLRVGWTVIRLHKFRAALTLLSIAIGTFSVVLMSSLAASGTNTIQRELEEMGGARLVLVFPKRAEEAEKRASSSRGLTLEDGEALRTRIGHLQALGMLAPRGHEEVTHAGKGFSADLIAVNQDLLAAYSLPIAVGRGLAVSDVAGAARVVVLGHKTASELFTTPAQALNRVVRVAGQHFHVVGVTREAKRMGNIIFDANEFVAAPITTLVGRRPTGFLVMLTQSPRHNDLAKRLAVAILRDRHNRVDDFQAFDFAVMMEKMAGMFRITHLVAGLVAGIALFAGGIGVMNILLVSVSERVREIGVRKALGASDVAVGLQFLFESALLSTLGGLCGAGFGALGALASAPIIRSQSEVWHGVISVGAVVAALASSLLIGVVFGVVPARKASRLQVVDCLRAAG